MVHLHCNADEDYPREKAKDRLRELYTLTTDGKPRLLVLNLKKNSYRCMNMRCGYKVALGTGFQALMSHLLEFHGEEISLTTEPKYYS